MRKIIALHPVTTHFRQLLSQPTVFHAFCNHMHIQRFRHSKNMTQNSLPSRIKNSGCKLSVQLQNIHRQAIQRAQGRKSTAEIIDLQRKSFLLQSLRYISCMTDIRSQHLFRNFQMQFLRIYTVLTAHMSQIIRQIIADQIILRKIYRHRYISAPSLQATRLIDHKPIKLIQLTGFCQRSNHMTCRNKYAGRLFPAAKHLTARYTAGYIIHLRLNPGVHTPFFQVPQEYMTG